MAELDLSALWSWTIPLWGLFLLALFLGGVLLAPQVLEAVGPAAPIAVAAAAIPLMEGGSRSKKHVRWASNV